MRKTLRRADLKQYLKDELGLSRSEARSIVHGFFDQIAEALVRGEPVFLTGLGKFLTVERMARPGRNPMTGESHVVPPRRTVVFRTGSRLKRRMAGKS